MPLHKRKTWRKQIKRGENNMIEVKTKKCVCNKHIFLLLVDVPCDAHVPVAGTFQFYRK